MGAFIGIISTLFRWAGTFRGIWSFIVPFWGMFRGRFGRGAGTATAS